ncbi:glycerophosphoryl diester phosphodiesterase [Conyzicola lurida]|uniref:glycerophosphodiester phosphodiesterase n=1 Tax=Conyzicola lurida TaxID=1172621 RepID=A0A841AJN0_9MICO|nr:glycerophosphoryl diester phosphodiesterase [Conyzicola lurida]
MTTTSRPLVIAHRGASGYRPEHTRSAYELAFALGADAVEPDIVATKDGVLVLRHENEISGTTDVAAHAEFASRKTTKTIDGVALTGWFTEDFTWAELSTLRAVERIPELRQASASFDGHEGILRLSDLLDIVDAATLSARRPLVLVAEIKHATYFESIGLPLDELFADAVRDWATADNLIVESFEQTVLTKIRARGIPGRLVFLAEAKGAPADLVAAHGAKARSYADHLTAAGLDRLAREVDGVSVTRKLILRLDLTKKAVGVTDLVSRAHGSGLIVFCWTLRAENKFLAKNNRVKGEPRDFGNWRSEFELVLSSGLDGVFADQPDLALAVLAAPRA